MICPACCDHSKGATARQQLRAAIRGHGAANRNAVRAERIPKEPELDPSWATGVARDRRHGPSRPNGRGSSVYWVPAELPNRRAWPPYSDVPSAIGLEKLSVSMGHRFKKPKPVAPRTTQQGGGEGVVHRHRDSQEHGALSEARDIIQRIKDSEGERITWKMEALAATFFVFAGNRLELRARIGQFEKAENPAKLWNVDNREVLRHFQMDIMRLLHNFLASAATLIDHTRIVTRELYQGRRFEQEYQRRMDGVFSRSAVAGFVKGLRNWMLHKGLVPVVVRLSVTGTDGGLVSSVVLDLNELKTWEKWGSRAKAYLAGARADPPLSEVVESYTDLVVQFYRWLEEKMDAMHASAFREVDELKHRLQVLNAAKRDK